MLNRCLQECVDEGNDSDFRSEPLRFLLHGVPGAGKSEVLYWLRDFFETICKWTHGKEFVYLASQNSMAALINGLTYHSFCAVPWMNTEGAMVNTSKQRKNDYGVSNLFLRYERLRWIFIDEFPTIGCEVLAMGEHTLQNSIRKEGTWALRNIEEHRPFGGLNIGFTGDFWQFKPIRTTAIFDDPFKSYKMSSTERVLAISGHAMQIQSKSSSN